ncbi:MAG: hypothetical protein RMJ39_01975 [Deltaproteobacteria bacterium]|nr:hypothetical protein [Deltaproteobacteria bacterium]
MMSVAEEFFISLKNGDYLKTWNLLSEKSKERILKDILDRAKGKEPIDFSKLRQDFDSCGTLCRIYWDTFVKGFNPDLAIYESSWEIGRIKKKEGEIILRYKEAKRPAILKMYKEDGSWKVGLVESFWPRKGSR